nr:hypothetical protein [uncultured Methanobacterium sp.]
MKKALEVQRIVKAMHLWKYFHPALPTLEWMPRQPKTSFNNEMTKEFPLKNFRDKRSETETLCRASSDFSQESLEDIFEVQDDTSWEGPG